MQNYFQNMKTEGLLKTMLQYVRNCNYNEAKFDIAVFKSLPIARNGSIDSFGNEFDMIIEPLFGTFFLHFVTSECDSPFCTNKCTIRKCSNSPVVIVDTNDRDRIAEVFSEQVQCWFGGQTENTCGQAVSHGIPVTYRYDNVTKGIG